MIISAVKYLAELCQKQGITIPENLIKDAQKAENSMLDYEFQDGYDAACKEHNIPIDPPTCHSCNGTGEGSYDGSRCSTCNGEGAIIKNKYMDER